jgi:hypothetical protein
MIQYKIASIFLITTCRIILNFRGGWRRPEISILRMVRLLHSFDNGSCAYRRPWNVCIEGVELSIVYLYSS